MSGDQVTEVLEAGQRISATTTGLVRGQRVFTAREFTVSRDQEVEPFIRRYGVPPMDRIFVAETTRFGTTQSIPELVVSGSIKVVA